VILPTKVLREAPEWHNEWLEVPKGLNDNVDEAIVLPRFIGKALLM
jgi:hypothetical protein